MKKSQHITAFIPESQSSKYQLHNIQIYDSGEIKNLIQSPSTELVNFHLVLKDLLPRGRIFGSGPVFKNQTSLNISRSLQEYIQNIQSTKEIFLGDIKIGKDYKYDIYLGEEIAGKIEDRQDSISLDDFYELKSLTEDKYNLCWTPREVIQGFKLRKDKTKIILSDFFVDHSQTIEMEIYVALPFSENFLGNDPRSPHADFLEKFQEKWGIQRPWRYTCVKNWILIPRFNLDGEVFFDDDEITDYARDLRYQIWKLSITEETFYSCIEKLNAYLRFVKMFSDNDDINTKSLRIKDQVQIRLAQEFKHEDIVEFLEILEDFFSSSVAYVHALVCDLEALEFVKSKKARLDTSFVEQSLETIHYLLKEHKINDQLGTLKKYVVDHAKSYLQIDPQKILFQQK